MVNNMRHFIPAVLAIVAIWSLVNCQQESSDQLKLSSPVTPKYVGTDKEQVQDKEAGAEHSEERLGTLDLLQGKWVATHAQDEPLQETIHWIFVENELRWLLTDQTEYRGTFSADDSLRPIRFEIDLDEYQNGRRLEPSAVKTKGILSVDDETLIVMTGLELKDYPQDFEMREGTIKLQFKRSEP